MLRFLLLHPKPPYSGGDIEPELARLAECLARKGHLVSWICARSWFDAHTPRVSSKGSFQLVRAARQPLYGIVMRMLVRRIADQYDACLLPVTRGRPLEIPSSEIPSFHLVFATPVRLVPDSKPPTPFFAMTAHAHDTLIINGVAPECVIPCFGDKDHEQTAAALVTHSNAARKTGQADSEEG